MKDQKPLSLENKINKVSNLVQKFNDGELSYQGLDNELDELYALPSKGTDKHKPVTYDDGTSMCSNACKICNPESKGMDVASCKVCSMCAGKGCNICHPNYLVKGMVEKEEMIITNGLDKTHYISQHKDRLPLPDGIDLNPDAPKEGSSAEKCPVAGCTCLDKVPVVNSNVTIRTFLIENREIWNNAEWGLIRMKWFTLEEKAAKLSAKSELVELKNSTVRVFLQRRCPRSVPLDDKEIDSLSEDICSAFGTKPSVPSIEAIIEVLRPIYMTEIDVLPKYAQAIHSLLLEGEK